MSFRVIVTYQGFNAELEEEFYFGTRRRPDQVGQTIVKAEPPAERAEGQIHFPETVDQHHRFLSYNCKTAHEAEWLASGFRHADGVKVQVVDDTPAAPEVPAAEVAPAAVPVDEPVAVEELHPSTMAAPEAPAVESPADAQ